MFFSIVRFDLRKGSKNISAKMRFLYTVRLKVGYFPLTLSAMLLVNLKLDHDNLSYNLFSRRI